MVYYGDNMIPYMNSCSKPTHLQKGRSPPAMGLMPGCDAAFYEDTNWEWNARNCYLTISWLQICQGSVCMEQIVDHINHVNTNPTFTWAALRDGGFFFWPSALTSSDQTGGVVGRERERQSEEQPYSCIQFMTVNFHFGWVSSSCSKHWSPVQ